jgi:hypothetical protein
VGRGEKEPFLSPSIGHQTKEPYPSPSIGHQTLEHSFGHQALDLPSPPFFKSRLGSLGALFLSLDIIFNSILRILVPTSFLRKKIMISLGRWEKEGE